MTNIIYIAMIMISNQVVEVKRVDPVGIFNSYVQEIVKKEIHDGIPSQPNPTRTQLPVPKCAPIPYMYFHGLVTNYIGGSR